MYSARPLSKYIRTDLCSRQNLPVSTIRSWVIGIGFVILSAFVTQLFSVRQPTISLGTAVVQLLAYPLGKAAERFLPDVGFTLWGVRHSLNPGPFNKKEHMLISIFANVGHTLPSTRNISKLSEYKCIDHVVDICSLYPMVRCVLWSGLCEVLCLPNLACFILQFDGIWSCWPLPEVLGVSCVLHMACVSGYYCFE